MYPVSVIYKAFLWLLSSLILASAGANPKLAIAPEQQTSKQIVLANFGASYQLRIALDQLNSITLPFGQIVADTIDPQVQMLARGSDLLIATSASEKVTIVVRDGEQPDSALTLILVPKNIDPQNYQIVVPQLFSGQMLLNLGDISVNDYLAQLSRLVRYTVEATNAVTPIAQASKRQYSLTNFYLNVPYLTPQVLDLVDITPKQGSPYLPLLCGIGLLKFSEMREFQPRNLYYSGIKVRSFWVENISSIDFIWQALSCTQANVMAAVMVTGEKLLPGEKSQIVLLEQINY
ncbi:hypothetical protein [Psittacicella melopsittaci]|uniref:hypothetical protein n=1 Tax=Psittacicella melopsittaci TaxID=2028576 RepID=UPI001CA74732|nr:hypothetical protein [Psittacicella melopsittaci]